MGGALMLILINVFYTVKILVLGIDAGPFSIIDFVAKYFILSCTITFWSAPVSFVLLAFSSWRDKMPSPVWFGAFYSIAAALFVLVIMNNPNEEFFGTVGLWALLPIFTMTGLAMGILYGLFSRAEQTTYLAWQKDR